MSRIIVRVTRDPAAFLARLSAETWRHADTVAGRREHNGAAYAAPRDLEVTPMPIRRVLLVGSCTAEQWLPFIPVPVDYVPTNHLHQLPPQPPQPASSYDVQLVQIPLRSVVEDDLLWHRSWHDEAAWEEAFEHALTRLRLMLSLRCTWMETSGILTLVSNFHVPQRNTMGRTLPRYDLRNPVYFIERLNEALARELAAYANAYVLDVNEMTSIFGKKYVQDDSVAASNHASLLAASPITESDRNRIEPLGPLSEAYDIHSDALMEALWLEVVAMVRTIRRIDEVKLVIVDLDDTLWRGVLAEERPKSLEASEGWPLGIAEALLYLKMRGILLAIVSKNDDALVAEAWDAMFLGRIRLDDFAIRRINWQPKSQNVAEILSAVNVLPQNVVFIDDNPRERAEVQGAFAAIRVLGAEPYYVRRVLLWAPETQPPTITRESATRTDMVRQQVQREVERVTMGRDAFLASLNVRVRLDTIGNADVQTIQRVVELVNKTNQFRTTGRRWSADDVREAIGHNTRFFTFTASDRFTDYGLIGVAVVEGGRIVQFVMSCRVFGLDVEIAAMAGIVATLRSDRSSVEADLVPTAVNGPAREFFARCGFVENDGRWWRATDPGMDVPEHIEFIEADRSIVG